jgi:hypothetical protein
MGTNSVAAQQTRPGIALPRLLIPALGDVLFVAALFWLFCSAPGSWNTFMGDANTGLHIRTGDYILAHGQVPHRDIYSFSKAGQPWFAIEWLSCVVYAVLDHIWGLAGIGIFSALLLCVYPLIQLRDAVQRGANVLVALIVVLAGVRAAAIHFLARPHLFTLTFTVLAVWLIARERERASWRGWLVVPLAVVWTNFHGGFLTLIAYLGLLAAGVATEGFLDPTVRAARFREARRWLTLFAASSAATLVNPYGIGLHLHIAEFLGSSWLTGMVQEYAPPTTILGDSRVQMFFALVAVAGICGVLFVKRRRMVEPLWIVFFGYMALKSARHIPLFVLVAVPIIACELTRCLDAVGRRGSSWFDPFTEMARDLAPSLTKLSAWGAAAGLLLILPGAPSDFPGFPAGIVQRNSARLIHSRVFTTDHWGDYLIYKLYPEGQRIFVDGRSDFFGERIGLDSLALLGTDPGWREILDRWRFDTVLSPKEMRLAAALSKDPHWSVADRDGDAVLFVRNPDSPIAAGGP